MTIHDVLKLDWNSAKSKPKLSTKLRQTNAKLKRNFTKLRQKITKLRQINAKSGQPQQYFVKSKQHIAFDPENLQKNSGPIPQGFTRHR